MILGFRVEGLGLKGIILWCLSRVILGIYWDNGKENGNYYLGFSMSFLGFGG